MSEGMEAIQDYAVLVTAGVIRKPDTIEGSTANSAMAKTAGRLGFISHQEAGSLIQLRASTDELIQRAFSEETLRAQSLLDQRLSAVRARQATPA